MSILSSAVDSISGGLVGGVVGAVGAAVNKYQERKQAVEIANSEIHKLELAQNHELAMASIAKQTTELSTDSASLIASIESDKATYSSGNDSKLMQIADFIRATIRPVLTAALIFYSGLALWYIINHYDIQLTVEQIYNLVNALLTTLNACTGIALGWWFGSRKAGV